MDDILLYLAVFAAVNVPLQWRNRLVYLERTRVANEVYRLGQAEIRAGDFEAAPARWASYGDGPSYAAMFLKFWRPVSSFYRDHPCLRESVK